MCVLGKQREEHPSLTLAPKAFSGYSGLLYHRVSKWTYPYKQLLVLHVII